VTALWLFLYLACLTRLVGLYTLPSRSWSTLFLVLPLLLLPASVWLKKQWPRAFQGWPPKIAGLLALGAALGLARLLNLDFWDTKLAPASALAALLGLGAQWVLLAHADETEGPGIWLWIAFWEYAGAWHPALTLLGLGLGACLAAFGALPHRPAPERPQAPLRIWPAFLLLGLALPKPSWDLILEPTWAQAFSAFALGAALSYLPWLRKPGARLPQSALLVLLSTFFVCYPSSLAWLWALLLGILAGWVWARLPRPIPVLRLSVAFLLGLLLSAALHANAGRPFLRHFVWLGGGSAKAFWFS